MQLKEISLEDVFPSKDNPRQDFGDIEALAESLEGGQPNIPIIVAQDGGIYTIIDGERRYRAMKVLGTKRTKALVAEDQSDADVMVAMVAADNKKQLTPVELSRGIQQALHFADVERVEKVSGRKSLGRVKRARAKVQDAADDMSLDRLLAIDELSFSRAAVDQLTNCREAEWRRVYDRIKQDLETERRTQELDDELEAAGIAKAMRMPDGDWGYFAQCGQGDVQKLVERADGAELVAVGTGLYRSVYRRTDEQVSRAEDERRERIDQVGRALKESEQRRAEWLGEAFIADALKLKAANEEAYRNEYLGECSKLTGRVFANVEDFQCGQQAVNGFKWVKNGIDWGYMQDPFVFLRVAYDRKMGDLYIFDELYNTETLDQPNIDEVKRRLAERDSDGRPKLTAEGRLQFKKSKPCNEIRADAAAPKDIATWKEGGVWIMGASKRVPVDDGIRWLQKRAHIYIDRRRCPLAWAEFTRYRALEDEEGRFKGFPDKDNHTIDAVRYAVFDLIADRTIV